MDNLQHIRAVYIRYLNDGGQRVELDLPKSGWNPDTIHISELGGCSRAIMLRLLGKTGRAKPQQTQDNDELMWWAGYQFHYLTYEALIHAGIMVCYETAIKPKYDGVTGRFDMLWMDDVLHLTDIKTVRPNAFKFGELNEEPPRVKDDNALQVGGYLLHIATIDKADVEYIDRGGTNTPLLLPVDQELAKAKAEAAILGLLAQRDNLPEVPDPLPEEVKLHYSRHKVPLLKWVGLKRDWRCNYCQYADTEHCKTNGSEDEVTAAEWVNDKRPGDWKFNVTGTRRELVEGLV
uniref:PD-(D/E)XK nuclease superfamily protein n=1 Tax=viral metagenome TaxID=1070528 RepID=A0A6M3IKD2_9ZZZZ